MTTIKEELQEAERSRDVWCGRSFFLTLLISFVLTSDLASSILASLIALGFSWHIGSKEVDRIKKIQELES